MFRAMWDRRRIGLPFDVVGLGIKGWPRSCGIRRFSAAATKDQRPQKDPLSPPAPHFRSPTPSRPPTPFETFLVSLPQESSSAKTLDYGSLVTMGVATYYTSDVPNQMLWKVNRLAPAAAYPQPR
jgi:hypothetical protein